jgi:hypothetical protein
MSYTYYLQPDFFGATMLALAGFFATTGTVLTASNALPFLSNHIKRIKKKKITNLQVQDSLNIYNINSKLLTKETEIEDSILLADCAKSGTSKLLE